MSVFPKRLMTTVGLLSAAALGLTACGGSADPEATTAPTDVASVDAPTDAASAEASTAESMPAGEAVEIEYMHRLPDGEGMTPVADIVQRWNDENPNIQVTATKFDGKAAEMITKLETDIKADNGVCLAQLGYAEVPEMFVKGLTLDVSAEAEKYKDNFGGAYGQMVVGETAVGLPQDSGPLIYMYNEAEFKELGIEVPTNAEEFIAAAKTAAAAGKYIANFEPDEAQNWLSGQTAGAGAVWYSIENDEWKVNTASEESMVIADFWQELLDSKTALTNDRFGDAYGKSVVDGVLVGNIAPAWEVGFALDELDGTEYEGQWRVAQLPQFGDEAMTGPDGGSGVAVMKGCEFPEQAMEFNNWFNTQVEDLASQGLVPAAAEAATTPEKWSRQFGGQDVMAELVTANKNLNADFVYIPGFSAVGPKMTEAAAAAAAGSGKVADVFTAAQDASIAALKDAGLPISEG